MKSFFFILVFFMYSTFSLEFKVRNRHMPVLVIHGGAGNINKENVSSEKELEIRKNLKEALEVGYKLLESGESALDVVEAVTIILEDYPLFNAGKGSVQNKIGKFEMDASIMDGCGLNAGAVAVVNTIKNPISAARKVMEKSGHVFLVGDGAEIFAKEQGVELVDPSYFLISDPKKKPKGGIKEIKPSKDGDDENRLGTVGVVALDINGNLAAGTSTGGTSQKRVGRIGDSPIIGAGTYANNQTCAVSCTGKGEIFIRTVAAYDVSAMIEYGNKNIQEAVENVIVKVETLKGTGGIIAVDKLGNIGIAFNTSGMYRGYKNQKETKVEIFRKE